MDQVHRIAHQITIRNVSLFSPFLECEVGKGDKRCMIRKKVLVKLVQKKGNF